MEAERKKLEEGKKGGKKEKHSLCQDSYPALSRTGLRESITAGVSRFSEQNSQEASFRRGRHGIQYPPSCGIGGKRRNTCLPSAPSMGIAGK